jgi:hypothetical protein
MKTFCILVTLAISFAVIAADKFNSKSFSTSSPLDKLTVQVNATADIKASSIELTVKRFGLNRVVELQAEIYNSDAIVIQRKLLTLIEADLQAWISAPDPDAWLQTFVLTRLALTAK